MTNDKAYKMTPATADAPVATFKPNETKSDKFIRLADFRVNKVIQYIDAIGNLSNEAVYEWTPAQIAAVIQAIDDKLNACEAKFLTPEEVPPTPFTLKGI